MNRSLPGPALASVALHGALLLALLHVRYEAADTSAFNVIQVEWVRSGEGEASEGVTDEGSRTPEIADASAEPPAAVPAPSEPASSAPPEPRPSPDPPPTVAREVVPVPPLEQEPPPEAPRGAPPRPDPPPPAAVAEAAPILPPPRAAAEPTPLPPTPADNLRPAAGAPQPPSPEADDDVSPENAIVALGLPPPTPTPHVTAPLTERERDMLDRRLERWARDLQALVQEEPSVTWEHDGEEYTATFTEVPAADDMGLDQIRVELQTARSGQRLTTEMRWQRLAFSHFAQFVDRWDPQVQIHDDEIGGRFHSNSEIYVANIGGVRPTFHGKVTTARGVNTANSIGRIVRSDVFLGGLETRVGRIALPARFLPFETSPPPDNAGVSRFTDDTAIVFYGDGTFGARPLDAPSSAEERRPVGDAPAYLLADDGVELEVSGVVDGKVLVHSPKRIVVAGNLVYAADPRRSESDDYLGLVSDGSVEIAGPDVTGPGDLTIHGAIFAKRRFQVRSYRSRGSATLAVYGSVAAGSLSATEPRYRTRLEFDPRLETARPPQFPVTGRYELADWDGEWQAEPLEEPDASFARDVDQP